MGAASSAVLAAASAVTAVQLTEDELQVPSPTADKSATGADGVVKGADTTTREADGVAERRPFLRLMSMQGSNKPIFVLGVIAAAATGAGPLTNFIFITQIMAQLFSPNAETIFSSVAFYAAIIFAVTGGTCVSSVIEYTCFGATGAVLTQRLRSWSMRALLRQHIGYFDREENSAGQLVAFLSEKIMLVQALSGERLQIMVRSTCIATTALVFLALFGAWQIFLVCISLVPIVASLAVASKILGGERKRKGTEGSGKDEVAEESAGALIGEVVGAARTVCAFGLEEQFNERYIAQAAVVYAVKRKQALLGSVLAGMSQGLAFYGLALVYYYGTWLISVGATTIDAFFVSIMMMVFPAVQIAGTFINATDFKAATSAAQQLFNFIGLATLIDPLSKSGRYLPKVTGSVELRDVHFAYPSAHAHPILRGLSVRVEEGTVCALVGASGSGKSTIIALMERFYDPHSGTILLDGVDISTLNVRWLRAQLGLVSQEPVLFQGTVEENIRYGKEGATREEVEAAAVMANAHGFITTVLANGYDTQVGQGGGKLSGGQKQRVAIARALIRKPSVLLLDEATSALDNESEKVVQAALDEIMAKQKRTTIVIAHRLSTIRDADKIVVVSRGAVVEQGTHDQLLDNLNGHYFTLVGAARGGPSQSLRRES